MRRWRSASTGRCFNAASRRVLKGLSASPLCVLQRRCYAVRIGRTKNMLKKILLGLTVIAFAGAGVAIAQQSGIKRPPLQKLDFPAGYNTVTAIAEVPA